MLSLPLLFLRRRGGRSVCQCLAVPNCSNEAPRVGAHVQPRSET
jgi:hypothetical protein